MLYRHYDTKAKDGVFVTFEMIELPDDCCDKPSDRDEGMTKEREKAYYANDWEYIGVMARATICVVRKGYDTIYTLESAGLFGIESDSDKEYIDEVFKNEKDELLADIKFICQSEITVQN